MALLVWQMIDGEEDLDEGLRALIYGVLMIYCFIGVSIIAETFMCAIEAVTSRRKKVRLKTGRIITSRVWNDTVANLTLMALGSSAPEILLAVIELFKNEMYAGELGPSTIVGSAAFNLHVIIAVCILAIPSGEGRIVKELNVFFITAVFSIFAYLWVVLILTAMTPDIMDIWEAAVTFLAFPALVWVSYLADIGKFDGIERPRIEKFLWADRPQVPDDAATQACDIMDSHDDETTGPGTLAFISENIQVQGNREQQTIEVVVTRSRGCLGSVSCRYRTEKFTAVPAYDFVDISGELEFPEGVTQQSIQLEVLKKTALQATDSFFVILDEAEGGAEFDPDRDGGAEAAILTVTISPSGISSSPGGRLLRWIDAVVNVDDVRMGTANWADHFSSAICCNGSVEEQREAHWAHWLFHIISLPWKLVFTLVPPASYCNGWVCFSCSLFWIGVVTAIIGDFAELFGHVVHIPDAVTAITFVALGTSMPDLFASHSAATQDPFADASICNVTGSNSVNVFLGLGLPWTFGALHWRFFAERTAEWEAEYPDIEQRVRDWDHNVVFAVPSGSLGFNVLVYSVFSIAALMLLVLRRKAVGCELGGPFFHKATTAATLVALWLGYIAVASWQAMRWDSATPAEVWSIMLSVLVVEFVLVTATSAMLINHWRNHAAVDVAADTAAGDGSPLVRAGNPVPTGLSSTEVFEDPLVQSALHEIVKPADAAAGPPLHAEAMPAISSNGSWKPDQVSTLPGKVESLKQSAPPPDVLLPAYVADVALKFPSQPPLTPSVQPVLKALLMDRPLSRGNLDDLRPGMPGSQPAPSPLVHRPHVTRDAFLIGCTDEGRRGAPGTSLAGGVFLTTSGSHGHTPQWASPGPAVYGTTKLFL